MKPVTSQRTRLPRINLCASGFLVPSGRGCFSAAVSGGNEGGGAAGSSIVLDELSAAHWEYWCLDLPAPQSAECGKWEVSMDLNMRKMSEKCSSWKTVPFFLRLHRCANIMGFPSFCLFFVPKCVFSFFSSLQ